MLEELLPWKIYQESPNQYIGGSRVVKDEDIIGLNTHLHEQRGSLKNGPSSFYSQSGKAMNLLFESQQAAPDWLARKPARDLG